jgi:hypothetical protein
LGSAQRGGGVAGGAVNSTITLVLAAGGSGGAVVGATSAAMSTRATIRLVRTDPDILGSCAVNSIAHARLGAEMARDYDTHRPVEVTAVGQWHEVVSMPAVTVHYRQCGHYQARYRFGTARYIT